MAVEVYKSQVPGSKYNAFEAEMWGLGGFFSSATHVEIIDSYSSHWDQNKGGAPSYTSKRWKGDPFADDDPSQPGYKVWHSVADLGDVNNWIVIECQTELPLLSTLGYTGLPKWQCKIQWMTNGSGFADVSDPTGVKYPLNHNSGQEMYWRFCPWGGWDKADSLPDFSPVGAPANPSGQNRAVDVGHYGSGNDTRDYVILDDGQLLRWNRRNVGAYDPMSLALVMGDVIPSDKTYLPMPRCQATGGITQMDMDTYGSGTWLCYNGYWSYAGDISSVEQPGMTWWDHLLARKQEGWKMLSAGRFVMEGGRGQPHPYAAGLELDLFPYIPIPYVTKGAHFSFPGVRWGWGVGFHPVNSKQWISMASAGESIFVRWDGSSNLF